MTRPTPTHSSARWPTSSVSGRIRAGASALLHPSARRRCRRHRHRLTSTLDGSDDDFAAPGVDRREIRKLKRGEYAAEDRRDLHGMTAADACASVGRFIENSRHRRHRCVCIVHGRGLHSEGNESILRACVRKYLRSHRVGARLRRRPAVRWWSRRRLRAVAQVDARRFMVAAWDAATSRASGSRLATSNLRAMRHSVRCKRTFSTATRRRT